jgi:DNA-binding transcriptional MerR regulator
MQGYSTAQVAKIIGVSKNTLLQWLYTGALTEPKRCAVGGVQWRTWSKADIERAQKVKATMKRGPKPKKR